MLQVGDKVFIFDPRDFNEEDMRTKTGVYVIKNMNSYLEYGFFYTNAPHPIGSNEWAVTPHQCVKLGTNKLINILFGVDNV